MIHIIIVLAILVFSVLVFVHELGHFAAAKRAGIRVLEFAIGMGPVIYSTQKNEDSTRYSVRAFPLGGFCEMEGEDDDVKTSDSFNAKPKWVRLLVLAAGSFMNLLFAFLILLALIWSEGAIATTTVDSFRDGPRPTYDAGLQAGDRILSIDGRKVNIIDDIINYLAFYDGKPVDLKVLRGAEKVTIKGATFPYKEVDRSELSNDWRDKGTMYRIYRPDFYVTPVKLTPVLTVRQTFYKSISIAELIWRTLLKLIGGKIPITDMSGPVGVTDALGQAAQKGIGDFLYLVVFISINLGVINLLPLPALDGGRMAFVLAEAAIGRPVPPKYEGYVHLVGFGLLIALSIFVTFNDVIRLTKPFLTTLSRVFGG